MYQKLRSLLVAACLWPATLLPSASLAASSLEPLPSSSPATHLAQNTYPPDLITIYMDSCVGGATSNGIPREVATRYCRCSIDSIQSTYSLEQFLQLFQSLSPGQIPPAIEEIATTCAANILN